MNKKTSRYALLAASLLTSGAASADEHLFGYVKGAEPLPAGGKELYQWITLRDDKGQGDYQAFNLATEFEYGWTNRFSTAAYLKAQSIDTSGLVIDGYLPGDKKYGLRFSGLEGEIKYNFLSAAKDAVGLTTILALDYDWLDPHSGQDKDTLSMELGLALQKYFLDGALIWVGNSGIESTYADRHKIDNLPEGFDWPTDPEMEIELIFGTGMSYRFAPNWFVGAELQYETEFETEVGQERWSWFGGPTLHYGGKRWWATATWFPQLEGGGETYEGQPSSLHLIEKTRDEYRLKLGLNF
jgi:hypothetical protein